MGDLEWLARNVKDWPVGAAYLAKHERGDRWLSETESDADYACHNDSYGVRCTKAQWQAERERLGLDMSADTSEFLKQARYRDSTGEDYIDEFIRNSTHEEIRGAFKFTVGKYNRRMGKKDDELSEVTKMADYCLRWRKYLMEKQE